MLEKEVVSTEIHVVHHGLQMFTVLLHTMFIY
jgi:hypothetical protein